ncbi:MAG: HlyD family efflux transporter periplasmic adaptor subunit [Deltaproteobacteria bacterium]|nr:HlyD family efflux transporter periplasmic adaptor subunit [Deltaproteobacteria bacterium]
MTESAAQTWLTRQCELIRGVTQGVLVLAGRSGLAARWPEGTSQTADLAAAANAALTERNVVALERLPSALFPLPGCRVAVPFSAGSVRGAVAVEIEDAKEAALGPVVDLLRLGTQWLAVLSKREAASARLATAFELVAGALEHVRFPEAATALATELAARLDCERVSIGMTRKARIRVEALSHSADFDARAQLMRDLAAAMDEAADQDAVVIQPPLPGSPARIAREHERLTQQHGTGAALTVPMASDGQIVGAVTFERPAGAVFDANTVELCEDLATLLGPVLLLQQAAGASLLQRMREILHARIAELSGADYPSRRLLAAALLGTLLLLTFATGNYRVTADATLEGRVQRAVVAGIDGYVTEANARAGDLVSQGEVLGRLDDRDLMLERRKWAGRRAQLDKEYREALAGHDRAQVNIISAKRAQAAAQLELVEENLLRTRLFVPFDGGVVRGDLSQSLGAPVERGDVLFEVAPLEGYRIILEVDERDVSDVAPGQPGRLTLSALPGQPLPLAVERITPVAAAADGRNVFRVEARLERPAPGLRPGMEGVAKIEIDRRRLIWIWTHGLVDWLRLWAWSWWP